MEIQLTCQELHNITAYFVYRHHYSKEIFLALFIALPGCSANLSLLRSLNQHLSPPCLLVLMQMMSNVWSFFCTFSVSGDILSTLQVQGKCKEPLHSTGELALLGNSAMILLRQIHSYLWLVTFLYHWHHLVAGWKTPKHSSWYCFQQVGKMTCSIACVFQWNQITSHIQL